MLVGHRLAKRRQDCRNDRRRRKRRSGVKRIRLFYFLCFRKRSRKEYFQDHFDGQQLQNATKRRSGRSSSHRKYRKGVFVIHNEKHIRHVYGINVYHTDVCNGGQLLSVRYKENVADRIFRYRRSYILLCPTTRQSQGNRPFLGSYNAAEYSLGIRLDRRRTVRFRNVRLFRRRSNDVCYL